MPSAAIAVKNLVGSPLDELQTHFSFCNSKKF